MIKSVQSLQGTKDKIKSFLGKNVEIKVNLGRNKYQSYKGKITGCYPALFCVTPSEKVSGKTSFSYAEYMCGLVKLKEIN
ncbi:MAG: Veg family protein [Clostridia bacterium]|nr:Veg family protein [Clostridia bacterium]